MKRIVCLSLVISCLSFGSVVAQTALWAAGSAVPDGPRQLELCPDGKFRFSGALVEGELLLMTTATCSEGVTQYLTPKLVDSYLVNYGIGYTMTTNSSSPGWVVSFSEDSYRFIVDPVSKTVTGELFLPWNELLIAGSAIAGGSDQTEWKRDNMLSFVRDHDNPYIFEWTGELDIYDNVVEPGRFKLEGQMTWGPRELHPFRQDEDILHASRLRIGGDDTKWRVTTPGVYRIRVNLFSESIQAEMLSGKASYSREETPIRSVCTDVSTAERVYSLQGHLRRTPGHGMNIVRQTDGTVRKVVIR